MIDNARARAILNTRLCDATPDDLVEVATPLKGVRRNSIAANRSRTLFGMVEKIVDLGTTLHHRVEKALLYIERQTSNEFWIARSKMTPYRIITAELDKWVPDPEPDDE